MWQASDVWPALVGGGSVTPLVSVRSSLGSDQLGEVPVESWQETVTVDGRKVTSTLEVRAADPNGDLTVGLRAPLGYIGQRLSVRAGFARPGAFSASGDLARNPGELVPMGQWIITDPGSSPNTWVDYPTMRVRRGGDVKPKGADLLTLLENDDLTALTAPLPGATVRSEVLRLVGGRIPVAADWPGVDADRPVLSEAVYDSNRLSAICDLLERVGAAAWVNRSGALQPLPTMPDNYVRVITDAVVIDRQITGGRSGLYNRVVVTSSAEDGTPMVGVASETSGPLSVHGPFGAVVRRENNPLAKTQGALDATAATYLQQGLNARSVRIVLRLTVPDYAIDPLDRVVTRDPDLSVIGTVVGITRGSDGMTLTLSVPWHWVYR